MTKPARREESTFMCMLWLAVRRGLALAGLGLILTGCGLAAPRPEPTPTLSAAQSVATTAPTTPTVAIPAPAAPTVSVPAAPAPGEPRRVSFAPGASAAIVEGAVVRGDRDRYLLGAAAGQLMEVTLNSLEQNAALSITGPDGTPLPGAAPGEDAATWSGTLPATGDYTIEVGPTRGNATYSLSVSIVTPAPPAGALRATDWSAWLSADPALAVRQEGGAPFVSVRAASPEVGGFPLLDQVVYGDIDGDGAEEAAITLSSGGTAGNVGLLVYRETGTGPSLAAWLSGYKLRASVEGGQLVVQMPIYGGWEPNCCPSGLATTRFVLEQDALTSVATSSEGYAEARPEVVRVFYEWIANKRLGDAYQLLADTEQAANPYDTWASGYADTLSLTATVAPDPARPEAVRVELSATDRTADGGQVSRRFAGTWDVVWDPARPGWALARPQIQAVP